LILLNEFNNPEEIGNFRFSRLFLPDSGELHEKLIDSTILLDSQVIGLTVITNEGKELGQIVEIIETGANDVFVVDAGNKEILLPDIEDVIKKVDLKKRLMIVHLLPGLILE
jgi:16S rRNA processing protein RimM